MKRFVSLVLAVLTLVSGYPSEVRAENPADAFKKFRNLGTEVKVAELNGAVSHAAGELVITVKEPKVSNGRLMKTINKKAYYKQIKDSTLNTVQKLIPKDVLLSVSPMYVPSDELDQLEYRLKTLKTNDSEEARDLNRRMKAINELQDSTDIRTYHIKTNLDETKLIALMKKLRANSDLVHVNFNHLETLYTTDTFYNSTGSLWSFPYAELWNLRKIQAQEAWANSTGTGVVVAVIDSGLDISHPDIDANVWTNPGEIAANNRDDDGNGYIDDIHGYDIANNDTVTNDIEGHGTHVSGTIAAEANNNIGIVGVAYGAQIMPLKVGSDNNSNAPDQASIENAINYAVTKGAKVINASLAGRIQVHLDTETASILSFDSLKFVKDQYDARIGDDDSKKLALRGVCMTGMTSADCDQRVADFLSLFRKVDKYLYAYNRGVTVVVAAGNEGTESFPDSSNYLPAGIPELITVGASTETDKGAVFSSYGDVVDIAAPGGADSFFRAANSFLINFNSGLDDSYKNRVRDEFLPVRSNIVSLASAQEPRYEHVTANTIRDSRGNITSINDINITAVNNSSTHTPTAPNRVSVFTFDKNSTVISSNSSNYRLRDGTSFSAPHVAGAAALLLSIKSDLTPSQVRNLLVTNTDTIITDNPIGNRLNINKAVGALQSLITNLVPTDITVTAAGTSVTASWIQPAQAARYVYQFDSSQEVEVVRNPPLRTIVNTVLAPGNHSFKVKGCNDSACSEYSSPVSVIVAEPAPNPVTITAPANDSRFEIGTPVTLTWTGSNIDASYIITIPTLSCSNTPCRPQTVPVTTRTYTFTPTATGRYEVKITALNASGLKSTDSTVIIIVTDKKPNPVTITTRPNISDELGTPVTLSWTGDATAKSYIITIPNDCNFDPCEQGSSRVVKLLAPTTSYTFMPFGGPISYTATIVASTATNINATGASAITDPRSVSYTKLPVPRPDPVIISGPTTNSITSLKPTVTWTPVANATAYGLLLTKPNGDIIRSIDIAGASTASYTFDTPLNLNTNYSIQMRGVRQLGLNSIAFAGQSGNTVSFSTTTSTVTTAPGRVDQQTFKLNPLGVFPGNLISITKPSFIWNAVANTNKYKLMMFSRNPITGIVGAQVGQTQETTQTTFTWPSDLSRGSYLIKIIANNVYGDSATSQTGFEISAVATSVASKVTGISVSPSANQINTNRRPTISWSPSAGAVLYNIKITNPQAGSIIYNLPSRTTTLAFPADLTNLANGYYRVAVTAVNAFGLSTEGLYFFYVTDPVTTAPGSFYYTAPTLNSTVSNPVTIRWTAATGVVYYVVEVENTANTGVVVARSPILDTPAVTSFLLTTTLTAGNYRAKVVAYNAIGNKVATRGVNSTSQFINFTVI